ncbi:MAG: hypothetical protein JWL76_2211 [Thermoleophilia bacterium]|nr:hypothetical protein [Thermoleophilia bacterium]
MGANSDTARNPQWQVRRSGGVLPPGFTKRFADDGRSGTTYFLGLPIGDFDIVARDDAHVELRYRTWPVVDVLDGRPGEGEPVGGSGNVSLGKLRTPFCRFRLER